MIVKCPKCATQLKFQPKAEAVRIKCPKCATVLKVPGQAAKPAESAPGKRAAQGSSKLKGSSKPKAHGQPAKKPAAAPSQSAPSRKAPPKKPAAVTSADPHASPTPGGFDLANLDLPETSDAGFADAGFGDPLAAPAAAFPGSPPKPALGKPKAVPASAAPVDTGGSKMLLNIGLSIASLLMFLMLGGIAFFFMSGSDDSTAQQQDSEIPSDPGDSLDTVAAAASEAVAPVGEAVAPVGETVAPVGETASPVAKAADENGSSGAKPAAATVTPGKTYSVGTVSASLPSGEILESFPTGIEGQAIRSEATKATVYVAIGKIDPEITDEEKIVRQVSRLVMADIYPGEPCQRSNRSGFKGHLSNGLVLPNMELELYPSKGKVVIIGWAIPQHDVDLFTPIILQDKLPRVEFDEAQVDAEKAMFLDSVRIK